MSDWSLHSSFRAFGGGRPFLPVTARNPLSVKQTRLLGTRQNSSLAIPKQMSWTLGGRVGLLRGHNVFLILLLGHLDTSTPGRWVSPLSSFSEESLCGSPVPGHEGKRRLPIRQAIPLPGRRSSSCPPSGLVAAISVRYSAPRPTAWPPRC